MDKKFRLFSAIAADAENGLYKIDVFYNFDREELTLFCIEDDITLTLDAANLFNFIKYNFNKNNKLISELIFINYMDNVGNFLLFEYYNITEINPSFIELVNE